MIAIRRARRGSSLMELLVSMTLLGVIGMAAAVAVRMQTGIRRHVGARVAAAVQLREAVAPLASDLAAISPAAGDIPPGAAADSILEFRSTVLVGYVCGVVTGGSGAAWIAAVGERGRGVITGDSLWSHAGAAGWRGAAVVDVAPGATSGSGCAIPMASGRTTPVHLTLQTSDSAAMTVGTPVRATRRVRYSFYRAGDGAVYLGLREWSHATGRLATVQPIAGPFDARASRFVYLGVDGGVLPVPVADARAIAAVGIQLVTADRRSPRQWGDSIVVTLRNAR